MSKKKQLRLPAELVAWRGHEGNLNVRAEISLDGEITSLPVDLFAEQMAQVEALYQVQHPTDVITKAIWDTAADDEYQRVITTVHQDDGGADEVSLQAGRDYPTVTITARRQAPLQLWGRDLPEDMSGDETDTIEITARLRIEDRFIIITKLQVETWYAEHGCWVGGYVTSAEGGSQSSSPLDADYTPTPVTYLLSSLHEGVAEMGEKYDFWPGYTVVLDGNPEDDARRSSHRTECFETPVGQVTITHESGGVTFSFVNLDFGDERLSASAWMSRDDEHCLASLHVDQALVFALAGQHASPGAIGRVHGVSARVAQHVLDTDPAWYGLRLDATQWQTR